MNKTDDKAQDEQKVEVKFSEFNFKEDLQKAIDQAGYKTPSPVQEKSIPIILKGKDLISQAQTGTGKTAAFGLPVIDMMTGKDGVELLVVVPTRELAMQVSDELWKFTRLLGYKTTAVFGGSSYKRQVEFIKNASILVATPGRLLDLLEKKAIDISPKYVVLDEADEMLNMGFIDDIKKIFKFLPEKRQTLLFSATMPEQIKKLAHEILNKPEEVKITPKNVSNENIDQFFYVLSEEKRNEALIRLLEITKPKKAIIFCRTKVQTEKVNQFLLKEGFKSLALHGDIEQWNRQKITKEFKSRNSHILVATDVAARGLDIKNVSHVFNYSVPQDPEPYVHRIGRTGRAGEKGEAHTFVIDSEIEFLKNIQEKVKGNLSAAEIPSSKKIQEEEFRKNVDKIVNQKVTKEGNKMISALIAANGGEEGLLEKIVSFLAKPEHSEKANISMSAREAQEKVDDFRKVKKSSGRRSFSNRGKGAGRPKKNFSSEKKYRWR